MFAQSMAANTFRGRFIRPRCGRGRSISSQPKFSLSGGGPFLLLWFRWKRTETTTICQDRARLFAQSMAANTFRGRFIRPRCGRGRSISSQPKFSLSGGGPFLLLWFRWKRTETATFCQGRTRLFAQSFGTPEPLKNKCEGGYPHGCHHRDYRLGSA